MKKIKSRFVLVCSRFGVKLARTLTPVDRLYSGKVKPKLRKVSKTSSLWVCRSVGETKIVVCHGTTKEKPTTVGESCTQTTVCRLNHSAKSLT